MRSNLLQLGNLLEFCKKCYSDKYLELAGRLTNPLDWDGTGSLDQYPHPQENLGYRLEYAFQPKIIQIIGFIA